MVLSSTLLLACTVVPWYGLHHGYSWSLWLTAALLWSWSGLSITAGYHRLWAHRSWQAHPALQWFFAIGGAIAMQNTILHWCSDHRQHHRHVDDNQADPYSAQRGFWFSHIGWLLRDYGLSLNPINNVRDLQKNPIVRWQHQHYLALTVGLNLALPAGLGWLQGDLIGGLFIIGVLRLVLVHHGTFLINSLAHIWGRQPYSDAHSSRDNDLLALLTFGEGYHNFHHAFEYDYRNGIAWWHFDPTKWFITLAHKLKLATQLRQAPTIRIEAARLQMQLKRSQQRLAKSVRASELLAHLESEYILLIERLQHYYDGRQQLLKQNRQQLDRHAKQQLQELRRSWQLQQRLWLQCRQQLHALARH